MSKTMTHEDVDMFEQYLRDAQNAVEHAGQLICSVPAGAGMWHKINAISEEIAEVIHGAYLLRPLDNDDQYPLT